MRFTTSITENRDFRRLYSRGTSAVSPVLAVYIRPNRLGKNRLGITVSTKIGNAVIRNRVRRRIKEAYRTSEDSFLPGYDIVAVARVRAAHATYREIADSLQAMGQKLGMMKT